MGQLLGVVNHRPGLRRQLVDSGQVTAGHRLVRRDDHPGQLRLVNATP